VSAENTEDLARRSLGASQSPRRERAGQFEPRFHLLAEHPFELLCRGRAAVYDPPRAERDDHAGVSPQVGGIDYQVGPIGTWLGTRHGRSFSSAVDGKCTE